MNRRWFKWSAKLAIVVALATTSCDRGPVAPEIPADPQAGLIGNLLNGLTGSSSPFQLVTDPLSLTLGNLAATKIIGPAGGSISLNGHSIVVPAGAVSLPTLFTMTAITDGHITVDLSAVAWLLGRLIDVGERGFSKQVTLTLSYANNTSITDPSRLVIVHLNGSRSEVLPTTVDTVNKTASAKLNHFSKYCLATN